MGVLSLLLENAGKSPMLCQRKLKSLGTCFAVIVITNIKVIDMHIYQVVVTMFYLSLSKHITLLNKIILKNNMIWACLDRKNTSH